MIINKSDFIHNYSPKDAERHKLFYQHSKYNMTPNMSIM